MKHSTKIILMILTIVVVVFVLTELLFYNLLPFSSVPYGLVDPSQTIKIAQRIEAGRKRGIKFDLRSKVEVFSEMSKTESNISIAVPFYFIQQSFPRKTIRYIPFGEAANKKIVICNESGNYITRTTDRFGFLNKDEVWDKNEADILLLGDSFLQSYCVDENHDIAFYLNSNAKVINLSRAGFGPLSELAVAREYGLSMKPKHIFWFFSEVNDLEDLTFAELTHKGIKKYLEDGYIQNLKENFKEVNTQTENYIDMRIKKVQKESVRNIGAYLNEINIFAFINWFIAYKKVGYKFEPRSFDSLDWKSYEQVVQTFAKETKSRLPKTKLSVVYLPTIGRPDVKERVRSIVEKNNIEFIDVTADLEKLGDISKSFPLGIAGHYNEDGHRIIGEKLKSLY